MYTAFKFCFQLENDGAGQLLLPPGGPDVSIYKLCAHNQTHHLAPLKRVSHEARSDPGPGPSSLLEPSTKASPAVAPIAQRRKKKLKASFESGSSNCIFTR
jgi:hypothetical protein